MAECHVVHLGRDSRILATSVRIRRDSSDSLTVDFDYRGQVVPVTEIRMTAAQARALADELTGGLIARLTAERDEARRQTLDHTVQAHSRSWVNQASNPGGGRVSVSDIGLPGGSSPPPSTGSSEGA